MKYENILFILGTQINSLFSETIGKKYKWRDITEVERRTADLKVPSSNPGGGATRIIRSFHDLFFDSA